MKIISDIGYISDLWNFVRNFSDRFCAKITQIPYKIYSWRVKSICFYGNFITPHRKTFYGWVESTIFPKTQDAYLNYLECVSHQQTGANKTKAYHHFLLYRCQADTPKHTHMSTTHLYTPSQTQIHRDTLTHPSPHWTNKHTRQPTNRYSLWRHQAGPLLTIRLLYPGSNTGMNGICTWSEGPVVSRYGPRVQRLS